MKRASKNSFNIYVQQSNRRGVKAILLPPIRIIPRGGINNKGFRKTVKIRVKFAQTGSFRGKHWRKAGKGRE